MQGVGFGLGSGMLFVPSSAVVSLATTFLATVSSLGATLILPILISNIFPRVGYWIRKVAVMACTLMRASLSTLISTMRQFLRAGRLILFMTFSSLSIVSPNCAYSRLSSFFGSDVYRCDLTYLNFFFSNTHFFSCSSSL